jgi:putative SOS response-associated peptidase YedK
MCGRFTLHTPEAGIRETFRLDSSSVPARALAPRYNIAPSQDIAIIRNTGDGRELLMARWGLVPGWSREAKTRYSTINARIETLADKPTYRMPFKRQRCLIPADGFYEWQHRDTAKIPHHIRMQDSRLFAFAGLWDHWRGEAGSFDSCTIIVMPANTVMRPVHERMPAIIAPADYDRWLDPGLADRQVLMGCLGSAPADELISYPVSSYVNSPGHDDDRCIQPAASA